MSTQTGTYVVGTYGEPILVRTGVNLAGATAVNLKLTRPDSTVVARDLGLGAITNAAAGEVTYVPTQSDLTVAGTYTFSITVPMSGPKQIVAQGALTVTPLNESTGLLVVEDGTGLVNANSYTTVVEANAYHFGHLYGDAWQSAPLEQRERALVMATRTVDYTMEWNGYRAHPSQALGWPRELAIDYDSYFGNVIGPWSLYQGYAYIPNNVVPKKIKDAVSEMARLDLISDRTQEDDSMGISSLGIGSGAISMSFNPSDRKTIMTEPVKVYLEPYGTVRGRGRSSARVFRVQ